MINKMKKLSLIIIFLIIGSTAKANNDFNRECKVDFIRMLSPNIGGCQIVVLSNDKVDTDGFCGGQPINKIGNMLRETLNFLKANEFPINATLYINDANDGVSGILKSSNFKQKDIFKIPFLKNIGGKNSYKSEQIMLDNGLRIKINGKDNVTMTFSGGFGDIYLSGKCVSSN
jgi:hypothetical protein